MADVFTQEERSRIMARIKAKDTLLELNFCKALSAQLHASGYRYRKNYKKIPGKPDVAFIGKKVLVFLDGDFWHGKKYKIRSKRYPPYWKEKILGNMKRDRKYNRQLRAMGYQVFRFWESDVKKHPEKAIAKIEKALRR